MLPSGYLTGLEEGRYSAAYRRRLSLGLAAFRQWLAEHGPPGVSVSRGCRRSLDGALALFVDFCHTSGLSFDVAKHGVLAMQHVLQLKGRLPRAWNCMKAWKMELPISHRIPLPLELLQVLFGLSLDRWFAGPATGLYLPMAVLMRVAFYGLLRPGEVFRLKCMDVLVRNAGLASAVAILVIRHPKNRTALGRRQFSVVRHPSTVAWLAWLVEGLPPGANLWPSTGTVFRNLFRELVEGLGCGGLRLTPGCLRPGGTTLLFIEGQDIARIQFLGRWAALSSLQCYIQEAMSHLIWVALDSQQGQHVAAVVSASSGAWACPPAVPRDHLPHQPRGWLRSRTPWSSRSPRAPR
jgi:hypothetical protein